MKKYIILTLTLMCAAPVMHARPRNRRHNSAQQAKQEETHQAAPAQAHHGRAAGGPAIIDGFAEAEIREAIRQSEEDMRRPSQVIPASPPAQAAPAPEVIFVEPQTRYKKTDSLEKEEYTIIPIWKNGKHLYNEKRYYGPNNFISVPIYDNNKKVIYYEILSFLIQLLYSKKLFPLHSKFN